MQASYLIRVRDHGGGELALFTGGGRGGAARSSTRGGLQSFAYRKRLRTPGGSNVRIFGDDDRLSYLSMPDAKDYLIDFERRDPIWQVDHALDFRAFHRGELLDSLDNGRLIYISYGQAANVLTLSEIVDYVAGSSQAEKSGDAAAVMAEYITENIGVNAGVDSLGLSRVRGNLNVATVGTAGVNWEGDRAHELLYDVLTEIADAADLQWNAEPFGDDTFTITIKKRPYGLDRRAENTAGNDPVVFSARLGNVTGVGSRYDSNNEINVVRVLGDGSGSLQRRVLRADVGEATASPWSRRVVSRSLETETETAALHAAGDAELENGRSRFTISADTAQTLGTRYKRDWDIGDFVTYEDRLGRVIDVEIMGVTVGFTTGGIESVTPEVREV